MGLRQTISEWVTTIKEVLDFGPEFPDAMEARRVLFAQESARLQHLLEQTQKASQEKDQLIARLQAVGAVAGNMVVDGPAYYIRRANTLDGPFCTSCFQRNHEIMRLASAPKPRGADGTPADWVQCARCKTPFRSDRISQYLNPVRVPTGSLSPAGALPRRDESRLGSPASQGTEPDDRRQKTEDRRQSTEPQSHPSSVLLHPPSDSQPQPNPPQAQTDTLGRGTPTRKDALGTPGPSPNAIPPAGDPKPASAPIAVSPQESYAPKPVKTARRPRKEPKRVPSRLGKAPTGETGPVEEAPQSQDIAMGSPAPTQNSALGSPSPNRTRPRARKPKGERSEQTKATDLSKRMQ